MRILFVFLCLLLSGINTKAQDAPNILTLEQTVKQNNAFAVELFKKVSNNSANICISPYILSYSLSAVYSGTKGGTSRQFGVVFGFSEDIKNNNDNFYELNSRIKNKKTFDNKLLYNMSVWLEDSLVPQKKYIKQLRSFDGDSIQQIDFGNKNNAVLTLNNWFGTKTLTNDKNFINLNTFTDSAVMIVTNFLLFEGAFKQTFGNVKKEPFYLDHLGRKTKSIEYLTQKNYFKYAENQTCQIIEIPYRGDSLSLVLIVPRDTVNFKNFVQNITLEKIEFFKSYLFDKPVELSVPKFKVKSNFALSQTFAALGMPVAFVQGANFLGIVPKLIKLTEIYHSAGIKVGEEETVLSTTSEFENTDGQELFKLDANRPFIFILHDQATKQILLIGKYTTPLE